MTNRNDRTGMSLLEVVLALAILAGAVTVLFQLASIGIRAAGDSRDLTRAHLIAESMMSEIKAGMYPVTTMTRVALAEHPGWLVSVLTEPAQQLGMLRLVVLVEKDSASRRAARYALVQWIRDPMIPFPEDLAASSASGDSSSSSGSTGGTNSNANSSGGGGTTPPTGGGTQPPGGNTPPSGGGIQPPGGGAPGGAGNDPNPGRGGAPR